MTSRMASHVGEGSWVVGGGGGRGEGKYGVEDFEGDGVVMVWRNAKSMESFYDTISCSWVYGMMTFFMCV